MHRRSFTKTLAVAGLSVLLPNVTSAADRTEPVQPEYTSELTAATLSVNESSYKRDMVFDGVKEEHGLTIETFLFKSAEPGQNLRIQFIQGNSDPNAYLDSRVAKLSDLGSTLEELKRADTDTGAYLIGVVHIPAPPPLSAYFEYQTGRFGDTDLYLEWVCDHEEFEAGFPEFQKNVLIDSEPLFAFLKESDVSVESFPESD